MTPVWPAALPQKPLLGGYSWSPQDNKASFKPDVGPAIQRRRATGSVRDVSATFPPITKAQVAAFEDWYRDDLLDGALHFLWADPVDGVSYKWRVEAYSIDWANHGRFTLSATLSRLPGAAV